LKFQFLLASKVCASWATPPKRELRSRTQKQLAAGGSGQGEAGAEWPARQCRVGLDIASFRYGEKRDGVNVGNGASLRKGHREGRWGDFVGEFGDDENIEGAEREEGGLELAAELFDRVADGRQTIRRIVEKPVAGVCGVADLMTEERHRGSPSKGGLQHFQGAPVG